MLSTVSAGPHLQAKCGDAELAAVVGMPAGALVGQLFHGLAQLSGSPRCPPPRVSTPCVAPPLERGLLSNE